MPLIQDLVSASNTERISSEEISTDQFGAGPQDEEVPTLSADQPDVERSVVAYLNISADNVQGQHDLPESSIQPGGEPQQGLTDVICLDDEESPAVDDLDLLDPSVSTIFFNTWLYLLKNYLSAPFHLDRSKITFRPAAFLVRCPWASFLMSYS